MVQKKDPDKHGSRAEPKGGRARPEKRLYSHQHQDGRGGCGGGDGGGGGGGGLKKMLSKSRSIKLLEESLDSSLGTQLVRLSMPASQQQQKKRPSTMGLPNYMKSTSSSNAKKEQAQVSSFSSRSSLPTAAGNSKPSDHLSKKKPTSAGGASGLNPANFPAKKPSLRAVRPPTKRIPDVPLCSQMTGIRATCSSTMKETSFPDHLDLNPGATEAEGTSAYKVCPYTYCSLNGHRHAPLPPLKCFLTARRRLLKTQRSMKLRGLPSFRKTDPEKEATEAGGATQSVSSLVEDLGDDFFLEIYAVRPTDAPVSGGGSHDGAHPGAAAGGAPSAADGGEEGSGARIEEDRRSLVDESSSQITSEDGFDQISQFSPSEMEVLINFLEFVECDPEDPPCQDHGDCWSWDGCALRDTDDLCSEPAEEEGVCEPEEEDEGLYIDFDEIDYSEFAECESSEGTIFPLPDDEGSDEEADGIVAGDEGGADISTPEELSVAKNKVEPGIRETQDPVAARNPEPVGDPCEEATPDGEAEDTFGIDVLFSDSNADAADNTEEKQEKMERDRNDEAGVVGMETWESDEEGEEPPAFEEDPDENDDKLDTSTDAAYPRAVSAIATAAATGSVGDDHTKWRGMVIGKRAGGDEEEEELRGFNPRPPNFLPIEPDPEAEKVDLRHQMTDDRKNSEEWMLDYALRRAVDKLAPGRKRKVALLVEAFETVAPVPAYGSSLGHSTVGLAPIQACS